MIAKNAEHTKKVIKRIKEKLIFDCDVVDPRLELEDLYENSWPSPPNKVIVHSLTVLGRGPGAPVLNWCVADMTVDLDVPLWWAISGLYGDDPHLPLKMVMEEIKSRLIEVDNEGWQYIVNRVKTQYSELFLSKEAERVLIAENFEMYTEIRKITCSHNTAVTLLRNRIKYGECVI